jgi:hypothetical protein
MENLINRIRFILLLDIDKMKREKKGNFIEALFSKKVKKIFRQRLEEKKTSPTFFN